jgi:hypothetical protein
MTTVTPGHHGGTESPMPVLLSVNVGLPATWRGRARPSTPASGSTRITEGHIRAGEQIVKTRTGPGALSVADADALLYLPGRDPAKLHRALQIPALSPGWQDSFRDLLAAGGGDSTATGPPPGTEPAQRAGPAWPGFRELRVTQVVPESADVSSIYLAAADGTALPAVTNTSAFRVSLGGTSPGIPADLRNSQDHLRVRRIRSCRRRG